MKLSAFLFALMLVSAQCLSIDSPAEKLSVPSHCADCVFVIGGQGSRQEASLSPSGPGIATGRDDRVVLSVDRLERGKTFSGKTLELIRGDVALGTLSVLVDVNRKTFGIDPPGLIDGIAKVNEPPERGEYVEADVTVRKITGVYLVRPDLAVLYDDHGNTYPSGQVWVFGLQTVGGPSGVASRSRRFGFSFDAHGRLRSAEGRGRRLEYLWDPGDSHAGATWLLEGAAIVPMFEMPKGRTPVSLKIAYYFKEGWDGLSKKKWKKLEIRTGVVRVDLHQVAKSQ